MSILREALSILRDDNAQPGPVAVAVLAVAEAVRQRLDVPADAARVVWRCLCRSPGAPWAMDGAEVVALADRTLVAEVVDAVCTRGAGRSLREAGMAALADPKAGHGLSDDAVLRIVDCAYGHEVDHAAFVVVTVAEVRGMPHAILRSITELWAAREDVRARIAAVDLGELLGPSDRTKLMARMLLDSSSRVRSATALRLHMLDPRAAVAMIDAATSIEQDGGVRIDLERARVDALDALRLIGRLS
ncbi:MAG: hypothetical protein ACRELB_23605 [Polyangiaceae bacterium]